MDRIHRHKVGLQVSALLEDSILSERIGELRERLTSLLEGRQNNSMASQITDFTKRVAQVLEEGQRSVTPSVSNLQVWSAHLKLTK